MPGEKNLVADLLPSASDVGLDLQKNRSLLSATAGLVLSPPDLVDQALHHLDLLQQVDSRPALQARLSLERSVARYERCWLPLAAAAAGGHAAVAPPLDVHYVWLVHQLSPAAYRADCWAVVGRMVDHKLCPRETLEEQRLRTRKIWEEKYPEEPFDLTDQGGQGDENRNYAGFESKISYKLVAAAERQSSFYYQVSLPHFRDRSFREDSLLRYKMFLLLKKKNPSKFLVPCYDIDLLWHTHQLNPQRYRDDCLKHLGFLVNHDDDVTREGGQLADSDRETRQLWLKTYDVPFARPGCMHRGDPP